MTKSSSIVAGDCIKPFVHCPICKSRFNSSVHLPIMIPFTCNKVMCWECTRQLTVPSFECPICSNVHSIPTQGYVVVEAVLSIAESFDSLSCHGEDRFLKVEGKIKAIEKMLAKMAEDEMAGGVGRDEDGERMGSRGLRDISNHNPAIKPIQSSMNGSKLRGPAWGCIPISKK